MIHYTSEECLNKASDILANVNPSKWDYDAMLAEVDLWIKS